MGSKLQVPNAAKVAPEPRRDPALACVAPTSQAMILGAFPPVKVVHTGGKEVEAATQVGVGLDGRGLPPAWVGG
jgi:hypothetical protein